MADESKAITDMSILNAKNAEGIKSSKLYKTIPILSATGFKPPESKAICQEDEKMYRMNCQVKYSYKICRSAGQWSMGLHQNEIERSIQNAYLDLIRNSQHLIYIENQFFVSSTSGKPVSNLIAEALAERVTRAAKNKEDFKLVICLPLLPGFEGDILEKAGNVMRIQLGWLYHTLGRGQNSIMAR
jgi:phosphatidylserine/phosphatidylglycerophosphate/cardiolipin synthase-like enzyme